MPEAEPKGLAKLYFTLEEKYYQLNDWIEAKLKIPVYKYWIEPVEKQRIPSFPVSVLIWIAVIAGALFLLLPGAPSTTLTVSVMSDSTFIDKAPVDLLLEGELFKTQIATQGIAEFTGVPLGKSATARVTMTGYEPAAQNFIVSEKATISLQLVRSGALPPGGNRTLEVTLLSPQNLPVKNATVVFRSGTAQVGGRTGTDGKVTLATVAALGFVYAEHPEYEPSQQGVASSQSSITITMQPRGLAAFQNVPKASVTVYVKGEDGKPIDAAVEMRNADAQTRISSLRSGESGTAIFENVPVGTNVYAAVDKDGYLTGISDIQRVARDGNVINVTLVVATAENSGGIDLRVTDVNGTAISNVTLNLYIQLFNTQVGSKDTDAGGLATFRVAKNVTFYVTAYKRGYLPAGMLNLQAGDTKTIVLEEALAGSTSPLRVTVLDPDDLKVAGATVSLRTPAGYFLGLPDQTTGDDGVAIFPAVPLRYENHTFAFKAVAAKEPLMGESPIFAMSFGLNITMHLMPETGTLSITLRDLATGGGVNGASVTAISVANASQTAGSCISSGSSCIMLVRSNFPFTLKATANGYIDYTDSTTRVLTPKENQTATIDMIPTALAKGVHITFKGFFPAAQPVSGSSMACEACKRNNAAAINSCYNGCMSGCPGGGGSWPYGGGGRYSCPITAQFQPFATAIPAPTSTPPPTVVVSPPPGGFWDPWGGSFVTATPTPTAGPTVTPGGGIVRPCDPASCLESCVLRYCSAACGTTTPQAVTSLTYGQEYQAKFQLVANSTSWNKAGAMVRIGGTGSVDDEPAGISGYDKGFASVSQSTDYNPSTSAAGDYALSEPSGGLWKWFLGEDSSASGVNKEFSVKVFVRPASAGFTPTTEPESEISFRDIGGGFGPGDLGGWQPPVVITDPIDPLAAKIDVNYRAWGVKAGLWFRDPFDPDYGYNETDTNGFDSLYADSNRVSVNLVSGNVRCAGGICIGVAFRDQNGTLTNQIEFGKYFSAELDVTGYETGSGFLVLTAPQGLRLHNYEFGNIKGSANAGQTITIPLVFTSGEIKHYKGSILLDSIFSGSFQFNVQWGAAFNNNWPLSIYALGAKPNLTITFLEPKATAFITPPNLTAERSSNVSIKILGIGNVPLPGATVRLVPSANEIAGTQNLAYEGDGVYAIRNLKPTSEGSLTLSVLPPQPYNTASAFMTVNPAPRRNVTFMPTIDSSVVSKDVTFESNMQSCINPTWAMIDGFGPTLSVSNCANKKTVTIVANFGAFITQTMDNNGTVVSVWMFNSPDYPENQPDQSTLESKAGSMTVNMADGSKEYIAFYVKFQGGEFPG